MTYAVLVMSVKGGTGKTLVATNIALQLSKKYMVGLIDADLDSPNLAEILKLSGEIKLDKERKFIPLRYPPASSATNDIEVISMFPILGKNRSLCKTGSEVAQIIRDIILQTNWRKDNEYYIIDMSAGSSGDEFKTVRNLFTTKALGAIIVTLPNTLADVKRCVNLCVNNNVRILGVIENMAGEVFGTGKTQKFCEENKLMFLGSIPLSKEIREKMERGEPLLEEKRLEPINNAVKRIENPLAPLVVKKEVKPKAPEAKPEPEKKPKEEEVEKAVAKVDAEATAQKVEEKVEKALEKKEAEHGNQAKT